MGKKKKTEAAKPEPLTPKPKKNLKSTPPPKGKKLTRKVDKDGKYYFYYK